MKALILLILVVVLSACTHPGSGSGGSGTAQALTPSPSPAPAPAPSPSPSPSPAPAPAPSPCASFMGTDWVANGSPTLTAESADQAGQGAYITEIDLSVTTPVFTESQYINPSLAASCQRTWSDGVPTTAGSTDSLSWTDTTGDCGVVAPTLQWDTSVCNVLTVIIRDGSGNVYETQTYESR